MDDAIISISTIKAKAACAVAKGIPRDQHAFNWHSSALATYLAEHDRLTALKSQRSTAIVRRADAHQGAAS